ncbi:hypothetical protein EU245_14790 [Lentibacillus lipolyticus]|nr:hypothetical protein EU245_14790 [Lentibacillus lipolyticus]
MFSKIVEEAINQLALEYTTDKNGLGHKQASDFAAHVQQQLGTMSKVFAGDLFRIGLEPINEFVLFFCMAQHVQQKNSKSTSVLQYANEKFDEEELDEMLPQEIQEGNKRNFYERKLEHYHALNAEKMLEYEMIEEKERQNRQSKQARNEDTRGNASRYEGNPLYEFQFSEFDLLDAIKEGEYDSSKANMNYKRIISDKGYLYKMTFKDFKEFVKVLHEEIDQSEETHKNIRYYKLERRLHFELVKSILLAMRKCEEANEKIEKKEYLIDLCMLFRLPLLKARQTYAEIYPNLNAKERHEWREEVFNLIIFLQRVVLIVQKQITGKEEQVFTDQDWKTFHAIYLPSHFQNNYKQRKDFKAQDFKTLMQTLDKQNQAILEQSQKTIKSQSSS